MSQWQRDRLGDRLHAVFANVTDLCHSGNEADSGTDHMQSLLTPPTSLNHHRFRDCPRAGLGNVILSCCSGNESRLGDCQHVGFGNVTECRTSHFAGAICFNDNGESIMVFGYTAVCEL